MSSAQTDAEIEQMARAMWKARFDYFGQPAPEPVDDERMEFLRHQARFAHSALSRCGRDEGLEEAAKIARRYERHALAQFEATKNSPTVGLPEQWKSRSFYASEIASDIEGRIRSLVSDDKERG